MAVPSTIRDELRVRLGSPSTTEISDAQLDTMCEVARRKLSRYKPSEAYATIATVASQTHYDLPSEVVAIRRLYLQEAGPPDTTPMVEYSIDGDYSDSMGGLSPTLNWPDVVDFRSRVVRDKKLYGGTWYMEGGKLVISPTPTSAVDLTYVYSKKLTFTVIEADDSLLEDLFLYALHLGYGQLSTQRKKVQSVSRIGQSTTFSSGVEEANRSEEYLSEWNNRVANPRGGPLR